MTAAIVLVMVLQAGAAAAPAGREAVLQRAQRALDEGRRAEAKQLLAEAADRFDSVRALVQLSRLQSGDGDAAGALQSLRRARALAPNAEEVLSAFAQVSIVTGSPVPAIVALDALVRMCPSVAQYQYMLGVALMRAGDGLDAVEALRAADQLEPGKALTLLALGIAMNSVQQYSDAKPVLVRALELEPGNSDALAALAEAEQGLGELDAAGAHARQALDRAPTHATASLVAGLIAMEREQYSNARDSLTRAVAADPTSFRAHYQLFLACSRLGDEAAAQAHLQRYRQTRREAEDRINELWRATGPSRAGSPRK
jgi:tetratricopeptide (TPR) repeat protein